MKPLAPLKPTKTKAPRITRATAWRVAAPATALGLALPLTLATPAAAQGGTAVRHESNVTYSANGGMDNEMTVGVLRGAVSIQDEAGITAGPGCVQETDTLVTCGAAASVSRVTIQAGDGDDTIEVTAPLNTTIDAGPGADTVSTGGGNDQINLGDGAAGDTVTSCGAGPGLVVADPGDTVSMKDCA